MHKIFFIIFLTFFSLSLNALTLQESVKEVLDTNPIVTERLKNFRATQQDLNIVESEYYPKLNLRATAGYNNAGELYTNGRVNNGNDVEYTNYESSLTLTQNLFDGFSTTNKIDYQEARILAAAYNYIEKANDTVFQMVNAYLNVFKAYELVETAKENVQINESIYEKVNDLYESGLTTESEVKKIQSSLSLAKSNLIVQKNNSRDAEYTFRRVLGRMPEIQSMKKPEFEIAMPESIERAGMYAIKHNPSLLVSKYNIKGAQSLWAQKQKTYYPTVDLEISQSYNDAEIPSNGFDQPDDRFKAKMVLNYNLYNGGADSADIQKHVSLVNQEIALQRDLKRQVIEGLDLSWSAYEMLANQIDELKKYSKYSETTLNLYKQEYDLGRRSLLDLLSSQNDVINSRSQIITAEYDQLFAKYRILDAMGLLPLAILQDTNDITARVNLYSGDEAEEVLDLLPVKLDADNDEIADSIDLCDNSLKANNIMPYGCVKQEKDLDADGVIDSRDMCPLTPKDVAVSPNGCGFDTDRDGIKDYEDKCPNTPFGYKVNNDGCSVSLTMLVNFEYKSAELQKKSLVEVREFYNFLKTNPLFHAHIVGHSDNVGSDAYNEKLSAQRAKSIMNKLIFYGIAAERLTSEGKGESEPVADNATKEGRRKNRRVVIELSTIPKV